MKNQSVQKYLCILSALVLTIPAFSQINEKEIEDDLNVLMSDIHDSPWESDNVADDIFQKIDDKPIAYLSYIKKNIEIPDNDSLLLNNDFMRRYACYINVLGRIGDMESLGIIRSHFYYFAPRIDERAQIIHNIFYTDSINLTADQARSIIRSYSEMVDEFSALIKILGGYKDKTILSECMNRITSNTPSIFMAIYDYLQSAAIGDQSVIKTLTAIYHDEKSSLFHHIGLKNLVNAIGGDVDNPVYLPPCVNVKLTNSRNQLLVGGLVQYYDGTWKDAIIKEDGIFSVETNLSSIKIQMLYEHGIQEKNNVPVTGDTVVFKTVNANVLLLDSKNQPIDTGVVQYYSGAWYDLGISTNGYTYKELLPINYKFRVSYAHASNEKYQDIGQDSLVIFKTVPAKVELRNSQTTLIDTGNVQYYSGAWYYFGSTSGGTAEMELLPYNYKFRMTYAKGSNEKYQDIGVNPIILFQTTNAKVELRNSQGNPLDEGMAQYYSGAWYNLGTTSNGVASKELLPYNYKFRMTYAKGSNEKYQDIGPNPTVVFQTRNIRVELRNSLGNLMDEGTVQYYSGAWYNLGTTAGGVAEMELLPYNYKFRMTYAKGSNEKYQDIGVDQTVTFRTKNTRVELRNSLGDLMDEGSVQYYSGAWYNLGTTSGGVASMELLPYNYKFRITYAKGSNEKYQDVGVNSTVQFASVLATVKVNNAQSQPLSNADVKYYSGAWYAFGSTSNGITTKELLPYNYKFRAVSGGMSSEKYQDLSQNAVVDFKLNVP